MFGKYRILSTLGTGNSSTVYLAEHIKLNVYRAIKCIPKDTVLVTSPSLEAELLKTLSHPGIPIIYDIEEDAQYFYLIEEFVEGESLDTFVSRHNISHELLLKFGIQLCDILDYLHHLMPYPILYQDLKPEHIIVCGKQLKLIDFGIASFFTCSGKNYQIYGTIEFSAPEALRGEAVSPLSDIFSLGKVLTYLSSQASDFYSENFNAILRKAASPKPNERYESVGLLREALQKDLKTACSSVSHLIQKITVFGSKSGIGATHIAVSLVSTLNQNGYSSVYLEQCGSYGLHAMMRECPLVKDQNGFCYYGCFCGIPDYGEGIASPKPPADSILVKDCGVYHDSHTLLNPDEFYIFVLSGSLWDFEHTVVTGEKLKNLEHIAFLCNYGNQTAAKKIAAALNHKVYCFPSDRDAFYCTTEKKQLFFDILSLERRKKKFLHFTKRHP